MRNIDLAREVHIVSRGSLTLPHTKRISSPRNFRSSAQKDFFNSVGAKRSLMPMLMLLLFSHSFSINDVHYARIVIAMSVSLFARPSTALALCSSEFATTSLEWAKLFVTSG